MNDSLIPAPIKYANLKGEPDPSADPSSSSGLRLRTSLVYDAICRTLSERQDQVDWRAFTQQDWELFVMMAENEGVGPLLHWKAKGGRLQDEWPSEVRTFLQGSYYKTTAQNAVLFQELERVLAAFETVDIPVIVLKGAALAQTIYPDLGLRPMGDIDLLVAPEHVGTSLQILDKLGFALWKVTYHAMLVGGANQSITLELHWCLHTPGKDANTPAALFGNQSDTSLAQPQAHFLHLCAHLFYQHFGANRRLLWGYDLYALVKAREIDWAALDALAIRLSWGEALFAVFKWLQEIFDAASPKKKFEAVEMISLESGITEMPNIKTWMRQAYAILPARGKITILWGILFPHADYMRWAYRSKPKWLWPLYYPYRWWDMLRDGFSKVTKWIKTILNTNDL